MLTNSALLLLKKNFLSNKIKGNYIGVVSAVFFILNNKLGLFKYK
jgi:hypothetical protein